jgi:hypothetical protein
VIGRVAELLFAGDAGAVYALASSGTAAEAVATWGSPAPTRSVFSPTDCWALRRGRLYVVHDGEPELRCPHVEEPIGGGVICAPLAAQTETLGLLHLQLRRARQARAARWPIGSAYRDAGRASGLASPTYACGHPARAVSRDALTASSTAATWRRP